MLGVAFGYAIRMVVDVLNALPKPVVAQAQGAAGGPVPNIRWVTAFIPNHWYLTDFLVALALGFLVLITLTKDGHPPDAAFYWYSAFGLGAGLGLFTNTDLITRLRTK